MEFMTSLEKSGIQVPIHLVKEIKEVYNYDLNTMPKDYTKTMERVEITSFNNTIRIKPI